MPAVSFRTRDLIAATKARFLQGVPDAEFDGVSIDTRTLRRGNFFFAIPGPHFDGHHYLSQAIAKGAAGLVVERLDERLQFDPQQAPDVLEVPNSIQALQNWGRFIRAHAAAKIFGITGSNGKTTTKEMLASILKRVGKTLSTRGNLNNHLGVPLMLSELLVDHQFCVLEMGASREGDIALLCDIARPQIGVITNIGKAHLEGMQSPEGVLKVKRAVFDLLPERGAAIINLDDPLLAPLAGSLHCRQITFGLSSKADVRGSAIRLEDMTTHFTLFLEGLSATITLRLPGRFQVMNALAAAAAAHAAGISLADIAAGLESFVPVAMRMQALAHPSGAILINDAYNANPSSVRASVQSFCQSYAGRPHWLVLGDMRELGEEFRQENRELGRWLADLPLDRILLYGRDTRFVLEGLMEKTPDIRTAMRFKKKRQLLAELQAGLPGQPVILFKGSRVMKMEQVITPLLPQTSTAGAH